MGQLRSGLTYCLSSFLGIYFQIKPAGFRKVVQCWVLPWPGTGAAVIGSSSISCIYLNKQSPFPIRDVFNFSRCSVFINICGCPAGARWTLHHSYSHDDLTFLLETKMCAHAAREWKLTDCRAWQELLFQPPDRSRDRLHFCKCWASQSLLVSALMLLLFLFVPFSIFMTSMQSKKGAFFCA